MAEDKRDIVDRLEDLKTLTADLSDEYIKQVATEAQDLITSMRSKFGSRTSVAASRPAPLVESLDGPMSDAWATTVNARLTALEKGQRDLRKGADG